METKIKTLGSVATYINGRAFKPAEWEDKGLPIIRIQNLTDTNAKYNYSSVKHDDKFFVKNGDLLFAWSASLGAHIWKGMDAWLNQHIFKILPNQDIDKMYLYYFLCRVVADLYAKTHGSGMVHITKAPFMSTPIPVPPIEEQRRIVSRIEELFSELDSAVETLQKTRQQLEIYRQAVLKEAFENCKIQVRFGDIIISRLGKMLDKKKNVGVERTYLRNANVRWFDFDLSNLLQMRITDDEIDRYSLHKGDLVICEGGEPGRCAIWKKDEMIFYQKALHRVRFKTKCKPEFYMYYMSYIAKTGTINEYFTGTGIKHLTGESLSKIPVPSTSYSQQEKITSEIELKMSVCDSIEKTVNEALQQAEAMRQSILKKAFEGRFY